MSQQLQPTNGIHEFKKRMKSFTKIPFRLKDLEPQAEESRLCDYCSKLKFEVDSFVVRSQDRQFRRSDEKPTQIDTSHIGGLAAESFVKQEQRKKNFENIPRYLGRLSNIRRKKYCPFCRLVLEISDRPLDQRAPSQSRSEDAAVYAKWVIDGQEEIFIDQAGPEQQYVPRTRRVLIYSEPQAFKDGYVALLNESAPFKEFFGRRLKSHDLLEPDVLQSWIRTCENAHGQECEASLVHPDLMLSPKNVLRAIDVDNMCVAEVPPHARFIALSYLWGKNFEQLFTTSESLPRLSKPGALLKERLPRTIKDTIKLTRMLGERYLWTDSLALIHDTGFQYHDDWIYARAHLTIVAGSGKDANAGLPGVREDSRMWHQTIEEVVPGVKLMVSHLAEDYIATSQWDSRAWTFQERMLSRRCLLFVNGRVYFQCRRATFCEDMEMPSPNGWSLDSIDMPTRIFREKPFVQFTSAVELYTRRDLTNAADILEAFGGVEQVLEKRLNVTIYQGLFEQLMDSSLIWESSKRLVRRHGFPSWSWAGWMGEIQWKFTESAKSWIQWHYTEDRVEEQHHFPAQLVSRIEPPVPWQRHRRRIARKLGNNSNVAPLLHFDTIVAYFSLIHPQPVHKTTISPLRKRLTGPSALSTVRPAPADPGLLRTGIADKNGQWCGTIDLDEGWQIRIGVPLKFLVMSRLSCFAEEEISLWRDYPFFPDAAMEEIERFDYGVYNVILVSEQKGICHREGLGRILSSALQNALEPEPCWQDVLLG
ncbi:hypothetical protein LTR64_000935 [Lithohypha guttulata]|uniref:uncharacterized protein n=1 Tax=Lithohypha guttulata TaxID=1690604 RepID=UPI002DE0495C|nr:hypothetical protein LTR51_003129 [Lithohypha guttulata]